MSIDVQITRGFGDKIKSRVSDTKANIERRVKYYAKNVLSDLIKETPVRSGQARANWQASVDGFDYVFIQLPEAKLSDKRVTVNTDAIADALDNGAVAINEFKVGSKIHIYNNAPYIDRLNEGYSPQAQPNYVQTVLANRRGDVNTRIADNG